MKEPEDRPETDKAVIVNSLSLSRKDWNYLRSLAQELLHGDAEQMIRSCFRGHRPVRQCVT